MQHTQQSTSDNAALEAWAAIVAKMPAWITAPLAVIWAVLCYVLNGHALVALVRWLVKVAGRVGESALLLATLYVTLNNVAHTLVTWILPSSMIELLNYLSLVAFSILPELIVGIAVALTYDHWKMFFTHPSWKNGSIVWAILYTLPTSVFAVMTIYTLLSFVQVVGVSGADPTYASGVSLTIRFLAGWGYSFIEILFASIGRKGYAEVFAGLRATVAELQREATELRALLASKATEHKQAITEQATAHQKALGEQATLVANLRAELEEDRATWAELEAGYESRIAELSRRRERGLMRARVDLVPAQEPLKSNGFVSVDDGQSMTISDGERTMSATGDYYERIKDAMFRVTESGQTLDYKAIAEELSIGYSTVRKYGPAIKKEIAQATGGQPSMPPQ